MYKDARSTCRAIVLIITPLVFFKMSLTCRGNFVFVKNVMTFKICPLVRIGPKSKCSLKRYRQKIFNVITQVISFRTCSRACLVNCARKHVRKNLIPHRGGGGGGGGGEGGGGGGGSPLNFG